MAKVRHVPERSCAACDHKLPKRDLIRIVKTPEGAVTVDPNSRSAGRGAYLCRQPDCWHRGIEKGGLERSLRLEISAQDKASLLDFYNKEIVQVAKSASDIEATHKLETTLSQSPKDTK